MRSEQARSVHGSQIYKMRVYVVFGYRQGGRPAQALRGAIIARSCSGFRRAALERTRSGLCGEEGDERLTVFKYTAIGYIDPLPLVRYNCARRQPRCTLNAASGLTDDGPAQRDVPSKVHVARHGQVVELDDVRDLLEALLELRDLLEVVAELDDGRRLEHAVRVDDELPVLQRVDVGLDEQQV